MASAWGSSWGLAWGNSWGAVGSAPSPPTQDKRGDAGGWGGSYRPPRLIYYTKEPPAATIPNAKAQRRKVVRKVVEAALEDVAWLPDVWTLDTALGVLPKTVPVEFRPPPQIKPFDLSVIAVAMWLRQEHRRRMEEEDEDDVELLLCAF